TVGQQDDSAYDDPSLLREAFIRIQESGSNCAKTRSQVSVDSWARAQQVAQRAKSIACALIEVTQEVRATPALCVTWGARLGKARCRFDQQPRSAV
ncbi:MAG: hypothetical protein MHM6MM_009259, partial [Cercozoa sp. M6MM]